MSSDELRTAIALGREQRHIEFKGPGARSDKRFLAKVVRAVMGMANKPDGGTVIIGVCEAGVALDPVGLDDSQASSWTYDHFHAAIAKYADPYVDFTVERVQLDGKTFVVVEVQEFVEFPVICKASFPEVLRDGALYVRRRGKNETVEVPSHVEMREVIERAAMIKARSILATHADLGGAASVDVGENSLFDDEAKDLL